MVVKMKPRAPFNIFDDGGLSEIPDSLIFLQVYRNILFLTDFATHNVLGCFSCLLLLLSAVNQRRQPRTSDDFIPGLIFCSHLSTLMVGKKPQEKKHFQLGQIISSPTATVLEHWP